MFLSTFYPVTHTLVLKSWIKTLFLKALDQYRAKISVLKAYDKASKNAKEEWKSEKKNQNMLLMHIMLHQHPNYCQVNIVWIFIEKFPMQKSMESIV